MSVYKILTEGWWRGGNGALNPKPDNAKRPIKPPPAPRPVK